MLHINLLAPDGTVALRCRRAIFPLFPLFFCHDAPHEAAGADGTRRVILFSSAFFFPSHQLTHITDGGREERRERGMLLIRIYASGPV